MEQITVKLGERARFKQMSAREAAAYVADKTEEFTTFLAEFIDRIRAEDDGQGVTRPDSTLPGVTQSNACKGCGSYVEVGERFCVACAAKPQNVAPKGTIEVGKQPEPAYKDVPGVQVPR